MLTITKSDIHDAIRSLLAPTDRTVVLHSNVSSLGWMDNLLENILDAICEAIGPDRNLLMPTFTYRFVRTGHYHHRDSESEVGVLTNYFRAREEVMRTRCPIFSFAVTGPDKCSWMKMRGQTCWGEDTVFERFQEENALILGLGEPLAKSATVFHRGEEVAGIPYRFFKQVSGQADFGEGLLEVTKQFYARRLDLPSGCHFEAPAELLRKEGKVRRVPLGMSFIEASHAGDMVEAVTNILKSDPLALLTNREEYEIEVEKKCFSFLGSTNLDLTASAFADEYCAVTEQDCRLVTVPFGQYGQQILDAQSDLRIIDPDYVVFIERAEEVLSGVLGDPQLKHQDIEYMRKEIESAVEAYVQIIEQARSVLKGQFIVANLVSMTPSVWGNADCELAWGSDKLIAFANQYLSEKLNWLNDTHVLDLKDLVLKYGVHNVHSGKYWYYGKIPFSKEFSSSLARTITGMCLALQGQTARLIVLDLDNTLWGGVIGDDELAGIQVGGDYPGNMFAELQRFIRGLARRGLALAVCSKNNHEVAMEGIESHSGMVLKKDDFAAFRINWDPKAANIRSICKELNLGTYSVLFLDDNPVEREMVRQEIPDCIVPELPENVSQWITFLADYPHLQTVNITQEDMKRTRQYVQARKMKESKDVFLNREDFLQDLGMRVCIEPYNKANSARILQLIAKTNQFNTTTKRYNQGEVENLINSKGAIVAAISLEDKFFQEEIIGTVILVPDGQATLIDSLILSCRVLGRDLETAILGWIYSLSRQLGRTLLRGMVVSTPKNTPVRDIYTKHGFRPISENDFELDMNSDKGVQIPPYFHLQFKGETA